MVSKFTVLLLLSGFLFLVQASSCNQLDRESLLAFSRNISTPSPLNWSASVDCCLWEGIQCDGDLRVIHLLLPSRGLTGFISPSLTNLTALSHLNLSHNRLSSNLPNQFFSLLNHLQVLDLSHNRLSGELPPFVADISGNNTIRELDLSSNLFHGTLAPSLIQHLAGGSLTSFNVSNNSFTGQIPTSLLCSNLSSSSSLRFLDYSSNDFVGVIQPGLGACSKLEKFRAGSNFLSGSLPGDIFDVVALTEISLPLNKLSGTIGAGIVNLTNLTVLELYSNNFTGPIPKDIGKLSQLERLLLHANNLTGTLPTSLMDCVNLVMLDIRLNSLEGDLSALNFSGLLKLTALDLGNNSFTGILPPSLYAYGFQKIQVLGLGGCKFTGQIPRWLVNLKKLEVLDLSYNQISGSIPPCIPTEIGQLKVLHQLDLSYNKFSGNIPSEISNLINLEKLYLSGNQLSGEIPISLKSLHFLSAFSVAYNDLQGKIPTGGQFDTFPSSSFEGNPQLCATENFSQANIVGCGGFGLVYKATLPNGTTLAIKKLSGDLGLMEREFKAEVEALSTAQHENLVALQGYCVHEGFRLLIYTYMENGSLDYWLHEKADGPSQLDWPTRLKIAQGASCGLAYMHQICEPHIVHRDIKSSNILLDEKFEARVADFGLARLILPYHTHVTTELVGTLGYIPPEYGQAWVATLRGDVYSFGVVMLELLTGRRPVDLSKSKMSGELVAWVQQMRSEGKQDQVFDPLLRGKDFEEEMQQVLDVACMCVNENPFKRPSIREVVEWLKNVGSSNQQMNKD
uniref:non-specific serine/threonine protein kinase n=1 Tax=Cajanus cajan TaxID=3821 RepID=A0A151TY97_CAJCA|nr:Tyrosine-sulfated glycopeptide receptor 1 [Cajanus cajan]